MATGTLHDGSRVSFDGSAGDTAAVRVRRGTPGAVQRCRARLPRGWTTEEPARAPWTTASEQALFLPTVESGPVVALPTDDAALLLTRS
jgi:hypothetical protein